MNGSPPSAAAAARLSESPASASPASASPASASPASASRTSQRLAVISIGALAAVITASLRQPLHFPGHKFLFWMPLILATRLRTGLRGSATAGTISTLLTSALLGSRIPGGDLLLPMAIASGLLLDFAVDLLDRKRAIGWTRLFWLSIAGMLGNLLCMLTHVLGPGGNFIFSGASTDVLGVMASFALFGLAAGAVGGVLGALPIGGKTNR